MFLYKLKYLCRRILFSLAAIPMYIYDGIKYNRKVELTKKRRKKEESLQIDNIYLSNLDKIVNEIKFSSLPIPSFISTGLAFFSDIVVYSSFSRKNAIKYKYFYPYPFENISIEIKQNIRIPCTIALQEKIKDKPALIIVPGLFVSRFQHVMVNLATRAFFKWNFNVLVIDIRNFGDMGILSEIPLSGSIEEGNDINFLAAWLKNKYGIKKVFGTGFSYGANCVLSASSKENTKLDGQVVFSPFSRMKEMNESLNEMPAKILSSLPIISFYNWLILKMCCDKKLYKIRKVDDYIREIVMPFYGLDEVDFFNKTSSIKFLNKIKIHSLIIHPIDDPVVSVNHSIELKMESIRHKMNNISFVFPPKGGHYANWFISSRYTEKLFLRFLTAI